MKVLYLGLPQGNGSVLGTCLGLAGWLSYPHGELRPGDPLGWLSRKGPQPEAQEGRLLSWPQACHSFNKPCSGHLPSIISSHPSDHMEWAGQGLLAQGKQQMQWKRVCDWEWEGLGSCTSHSASLSCVLSVRTVMSDRPCAHGHPVSPRPATSLR